MKFDLDALPVVLPCLISAGDCIHPHSGPSLAQGVVFYFRVVVRPSLRPLSIGLHLDHTLVPFILFPFVPFFPFIRVVFISPDPSIERREWGNVYLVQHLHV
jgi:hypothetical protein